jgi:diadenosine tetraphosphate (Ap4A) HIT family hydrolase
VESIDCPFCHPEESRIVLRNKVGFVLRDGFPVTPGHLLIVPNKHIRHYFEADPAEKRELWALVEEAKRYLDSKESPDGYNIGINVGEAAGQTVFHLHIHLIPRRKGDVKNPRGGVRHVIPGKGSY